MLRPQNHKCNQFPILFSELTFAHAIQSKYLPITADLETETMHDTDNDPSNAASRALNASEPEEKPVAQEIASDDAPEDFVKGKSWRFWAVFPSLMITTLLSAMEVTGTFTSTTQDVITGLTRTLLCFSRLHSSAHHRPRPQHR